MTDNKTGLKHDYTKRHGVLCTTMQLPEGVPTMSRSELWNKAEAAETRKNSTVAREIEVSLPIELSPKKMIALANEFSSWLVARHGFAADTSVHQPTEKNDDSNWHAHILTTTRRMDSSGELGAKCRELDAAKTGSVEILAWREKWAEICNRELEAGGHTARVDHRSHADRGLEELPTVHVGHGPKSADNAAYNAEAETLNAEIRAALLERAALVAAEAIKEATAHAKAVIEQTLIEAEIVPETAVQSVLNSDVAGAALTPAEIAEVKALMPVAGPVTKAAVVHAVQDAAQHSAVATHAKAKAKLDALGSTLKKANAVHLKAYDAAQAALSEQRKAGGTLWGTIKGIFKMPGWKRAEVAEAVALAAAKGHQARYSAQHAVVQRAFALCPAVAPAVAPVPSAEQVQQAEIFAERARQYVLNLPQSSISNGQRQRLDVPKG